MKIYLGFSSAIWYLYHHGSEWLAQLAQSRETALTSCAHRLKTIREAGAMLSDLTVPQAHNPGCACNEGTGVDKLHILVPSGINHCTTKDIVRHQWSGAFPRGSFRVAKNGVLVSIPEFAFMQMASVLPFVQLVQLGCALVASYRIDSETLDIVSREPLSSKERIRAFLERMRSVNPRARGLRQANEALKYVCEGSESPMETVLYLLVSLPRNLGCGGIKGIKMNYTVQLGSEQKKVLDRPDRRSVRIDMGIPERKLGLEFHGKQHEKTVHEDRNRLNMLTSLGYRVLQVVYADLSREDLLERALSQTMELFEGSADALSAAERAARGRVISMMLGPDRLVL